MKRQVMKNQQDIYEGENLTTVVTRHPHEALAGAVPAFDVPGDDCSVAACAVGGDNRKRKKGGRRRMHEARFKGYTLEELKLRRVVNELKIASVKDRLMLMVSPQKKSEANTISSYIHGFDSFIKYLDIAMLAYGITRRVSGFFRRFSRRR